MVEFGDGEALLEERGGGAVATIQRGRRPHNLQPCHVLFITYCMCIDKKCIKTTVPN